MNSPAIMEKPRPAPSQIVEGLRNDFSVFRKKRKGLYSPIPRKLRKAVLAAIDDGITQSAVKSACGVTTSQLDKWRSQICVKSPAANPAPLSTEELKDVMVLNVLDNDEPGKQINRGLHVMFAIGSLRVSIQLG